MYCNCALGAKFYIQIKFTEAKRLIVKNKVVILHTFSAYRVQ